ncbi:Uncharacterised protein [Mycobacteroides abscessus subsp. abscessus]|nr:Uncharacterised protein [Mycobacteroides abscessus subsp. abscessus]
MITANKVRNPNEAASAARRPCCRRSSAGPISGAMTANGAMVISRYSATLLLDSAVAAAKKSVLARATAIAASTAKLAITGYVRAVRPDLSAPSAVAAFWNSPYIREPISRLRIAATRVTVSFCGWSCSGWGRRRTRSRRSSPSGGR